MNKVTLVLGPIDNAKELRRLVIDEDGNVKFQVIVDLSDIIDLNLEGFNDLMCEKLSEKWGHGLNDISYSVQGFSPGNDCGIASGQVIIQVDSGFDWDIVDEDWGVLEEVSGNG